MSIRNFNNVTTIGTLVGPVASSATAITVQNFNQAPSVPYTVTIDRNLATEEICLVTAQAGGSLTVVRGFDGSAAQSHAAGSTIEHTAGAIEYAEANQHVNGTVGVHGTTGDLVGTEGAQSLFDKTLVAPLVQADVADGDAIVAYDPTGTRNLFRGMNQTGTDVITVDNTGKVNAAGLTVSGASTLSGALNANGGITVPAGKTLTASGGVSATTVTASGAVTASGTVTAPTVSVSGTVSAGAVNSGAVTGTGLVKGAGVESTAGLTVAQIAAPSGVASKGQVWQQSDGGLYTRAGTGAVARIPQHWGSGTTPPSSGMLVGDRYAHTQYGPMTYSGTAWLPDSPLHGFVQDIVTPATTVSVSGTWTVTLPALPSSVVAGMRVRGDLSFSWSTVLGTQTQTLQVTSITSPQASISFYSFGIRTGALAGDNFVNRVTVPIQLTVTGSSPVITFAVVVGSGGTGLTFGQPRLDFITGFAA